MTYKEAIEVKKALLVLAEYLGVTPEKVASNVCFFDREKWKKLIEASNLWNEFEDMNIVERGRVLGIKIEIE